MTKDDENRFKQAKEEEAIRLQAEKEVRLAAAERKLSQIETKLLIKSVLSDSRKGAQFMSCNLKDFFLSTPIDAPEFMRILNSFIPIDIWEKYNLDSKVARHGYI